MSMQGDMAREDLIKDYCRQLKEHLTMYPGASEALKHLGRIYLDDLPNVPEWAREYVELFAE